MFPALAEVAVAGSACTLAGAPVSVWSCMVTELPKRRDDSRRTEPAVGVLDQGPALDDSLDVIGFGQLGDIGQRIEVDDDEVGEFAFLHGAHISRETQQFCGVLRARHDRLHRCQAEFDGVHLFAQVESVWAHACISACLMLGLGVLESAAAPLSVSTGAGLAIAGLPLTIGGIVGGVLTSMLVHSRRMRAVAVVAYGAIGGLALTLVLQSWFGILQGNFGLNVLAAGLAVAATAALINGFVSLIGPGGIAIGAVLTMFIGNPIASLQAPKEFLAGAWGDIGQFFVPGASGTLLRDLSYFPDAPMAMQWWALIGWFSLGIILVLVGHFMAHSKKRVAVS